MLSSAGGYSEIFIVFRNNFITPYLCEISFLFYSMNEGELRGIL